MSQSAPSDALLRSAVSVLIPLVAVKAIELRLAKKS